ncbi:hypothetical protein GCM10010174_05730 [Kutzneria viridogrisea]|uniref:Uncharacterized protein n=2 Tax=Kutzneria TaxID=43356 RepID=W5WAQ0_9PSEU|nr:hypothetical protein [Kutzneria albida]AHH98017.1 hypothetical protein KALB_4655 [Kutzneria albida DSM 43870]MBA8924325.1 hypothetical protein [Kutzneria viridogrisea]
MTIPPIEPEPQPDEERPIGDPHFGAPEPLHGSGPGGPDIEEPPLDDPEDEYPRQD